MMTKSVTFLLLTVIFLHNRPFPSFIQHVRRIKLTLPVRFLLEIILFTVAFVRHPRSSLLIQAFETFKFFCHSDVLKRRRSQIRWYEFEPKREED